jgi:hypothetical protein
MEMTSAKASRSPNRVDRPVQGDPIAVGERTVQPVARVSGWRGSNQSTGAAGAGGWLHITPVEVVVREQDGAEQHIPITDETATALRGIVLAALAVAIPCWAILLILRRRSSRRPKRKMEEAK